MKLKSPYLLLQNSSGDVSATFGVFFDSFTKIAISVVLCLGTIGLSPNIVYKQILPGVSLALLVLHLAYYIQAKLMSKHHPHITALPAGLQSSCVFVWLLALMLPISLETHNPLLAYQVALLANFINGILFIVFGLLFVKFKSLIPRQVLLGVMAGTAFTWLTLNNIAVIFNHPISGVIPLIFLLIALITKLKLPISAVAISAIMGCVLAIMLGEIHPLHVMTLKWSLPSLYLFKLINPLLWHYIWSYLPLIIAFAIIDAISAIQIIEEAYISSIRFNPTITILISGVISSLSALFGNPFALGLFFGHSSWSEIKATYRYPVVIATMFALTGFCGLLAIIVHYVPDWISLSILIFIGTSTTALALAEIEAKYYVIVLIAFIPIMLEMVYTKISVINHSLNATALNLTIGGNGLFILSHGAILSSLFLASYFFYMLDKLYIRAIIMAIILLVLSTLGLIHVASPGFYLAAPMNYAYAFMIGVAFIIYYYDNHKTPML